MKPNYRKCLSCRRIDLKDSFWRVVRISDSAKVQLDVGQGRSAYICRQQSCLKTACQKNRLARALKASVPQQIYDILLARLAATQAQQSQSSSPPVQIVPKG